MEGVLHVGFYNYVTTDAVIALLDYKLVAAKKIIKSAKDEKPRSVMDVTRGRKAQTLIVLSGDRYVISAIYRQQLAKRLATVPELDPSEILTPLTLAPVIPEGIFIDAEGEGTRSQRERDKALPTD